MFLKTGTAKEIFLLSSSKSYSIRVYWTIVHPFLLHHLAPTSMILPTGIAIAHCLKCSPYAQPHECLSKGSGAKRAGLPTHLTGLLYPSGAQCQPSRCIIASEKDEITSASPDIFSYFQLNFYIIIIVLIIALNSLFLWETLSSFILK